MESKDSLSVLCEKCNEACEETTTVTTRKLESRRIITQEWCESCRDDYAFACTDCENWYSTEYFQWREDICNSCSDNYAICEDCDSIVRSEHAYFCDECGHTYCDSCRCSCGEKSGSIHGYKYKPSAIFHGGAGIMHYGIELEVDCAQHTAKDTLYALGGEWHAYLKEDDSIASGYEIVSHPHTLNAHRELWEKFWAHARRNHLDADKNGMHVHIQRLYLTKYRIGMMQAFLNEPANEGFVTAIAGRDSRSYAALKPALAKVSADGTNDRYQALNLENERTVEIRIFRGTTDKARFFANLEFCDALVAFTIDRGYMHLTVKEFCAFVRKGRKTWRALDDWMVSANYLPKILTKQEKTKGREVALCA